MADDITIFWEAVPGGVLDLSAPLGLGNIAVAPGETEAQEIKVYYSTAGSCRKLVNCGLYLAPYTLPYPAPQESSAYRDWVEVKRWGDLVGLASPVGFLVNMNKQDDYPDSDWVQLNSRFGFSSYTPLRLSRGGVRLAGGSYHDTDGELPLGAEAYFKVKVASPAGIGRAGYRYLALVLEYEAA